MTAKFRPVAIDAAIAVGLLLLTVVTYAAVRNHDFVAIDDQTYVVENTNIHDGLSIEMVKWAFTTGHAGNWHPLTWISHAIDCQLFGLDPGPHHLVNVGFHCLNSILLFVALRWMTGNRWASAFVAALFALHPLHVESVAWLSERKDVLSTFFWMLTLLAYTWYVRRGGWLRYGAVFLVLAVGLTAKPMLVTLPLILLLLDIWPLRRYAPAFNSPWQLVYLAAEKLPLLALSAICSLLTLKMQSSGAAVASFERWPIPNRVGNAALSCVIYLQDMLWPSGLAYFYPIQELAWKSPWTWFLATGAVLLLCVVTLFAFLLARRSPFFLVGWLWFLITLIPVIGIVQVGQQSRADRYMYIPMVGPAIILAWSGLAISRRGPKAKAAVTTIAVAAVALCVPLTMRQVLTWRNSEVMYTRGIEVTKENDRAHTGLGFVRRQQGQMEEAIRQYRIALAYNPQNSFTQHRLGVAYSLQGYWVDAEEALRRPFAARPDLYQTRVALARVLIRQKRLIEAADQYKAVMNTPEGRRLFEAEAREFAQSVENIDERIIQAATQMQSDPNNAQSRVTLARAFYDRGQLLEAEREARIAVSLEREWAEPHSLLAQILRLKSEYADAAAEYQRTLELSPGADSARMGLRTLLEFLGRHTAVKVDTDKVQSASQVLVELEPDSFEAHWVLGRSLAAKDETAQAIEHLRKALELSNQRPAIAAELAMILATTKQTELRDVEEAVKLAQSACEAMEYTDITHLKALATAQAEAKDYPAAVQTLERALYMAKLRKDTNEIRRLSSQIDRYANR